MVGQLGDVVKEGRLRVALPTSPVLMPSPPVAEERVGKDT
jgi:hypothetical protein